MINFNIFFGNRLSPEILVAIHMKNPNITLKDEKRILEFFNICVRDNEKQVVQSTTSSVNNYSRILFNS